MDPVLESILPALARSSFWVRIAQPDTKVEFDPYTIPAASFWKHLGGNGLRISWHPRFGSDLSVLQNLPRLQSLNIYNLSLYDCDPDLNFDFLTPVFHLSTLKHLVLHKSPASIIPSYPQVRIFTY